MSRHQRKDFHLGPYHLIWRGYDGSPQYGFLAWSIRRIWTFDVWVHQRLLTVRKREH